MLLCRKYHGIPKNDRNGRVLFKHKRGVEERKRDSHRRQETGAMRNTWRRSVQECVKAQSSLITTRARGTYETGSAVSSKSHLRHLYRKLK